jgi:hypothetical protein
MANGIIRSSLKRSDQVICGKTLSGKNAPLLPEERLLYHSDIHIILATINIQMKNRTFIYTSIMSIIVAIIGALGLMFSGTIPALITKSGNPSVLPTVTSTPAATVTSTANTNLVANGSFEDLTSGWTNNWTKDSDSFSIDTSSQGNNGTHSLHLLLLSPSKAKTHVESDKMNVDGVSTYYWKQYVKTLRASGKLTFYIDEYDEAGNEIPEHPGQWKGEINSLVTGPYALPPYTPTSPKVKKVALQITAEPNSTFDIYLDSVMFSK